MDKKIETKIRWRTGNRRDTGSGNTRTKEKHSNPSMDTLEYKRREVEVLEEEREGGT